MKAISYAIFGYERERVKNCFDHDCYVRGLMVNVRFNRVLYPNWVNVLNIDGISYQAYRPFYDWLQNKGLILINICDDDTQLCKAMLWRMKPVFSYKHPNWVYTHVICRDVDSISTYREVQAVTQWVQEDKTIHCITDSISHTIPMMGGMIGFRPAHLTSKLGVGTWDDMFSLGHGIDFRRKGADQDFLNKYVYPKVADSATEHFILGMKQNIQEADGRHYSIPDIETDVDPIFKNTNDCAGHIGAAGYYETPTIKWLRHSDPYESEYADIEKHFPKLFFWRG